MPRPDIFDPNCGSRRALELISGRWRLLLFYALRGGPMRHGELRRRLRGISQKMLTQTLREMEARGLVARKTVAGAVPGVEYCLTPLGASLLQPLAELCRWAESHAEAFAAVTAATPP